MQLYSYFSNNRLSSESFFPYREYIDVKKMNSLKVTKFKFQLEHSPLDFDH